MCERWLYKLRLPTLEELVYKRLLLLDGMHNNGRVKKRVIPFPKVREFICPVYSLKKEDLEVILYHLARLDLIKIIEKHGVRVND